ncbi:major capsid protein [Brevundimonas sp. NPDC058933]|uniref:major capsid protein n=1 Tax=Brevundimonas sp. NPDC058933 TaxID=3346673 RepID=UPI003BEEDE10
MEVVGATSTVGDTSFMTTLANMLPNGDSRRIFENQIRVKATLQSKLRQAGLFAISNDLNARAAGAGNISEIRFMNPLTGDSVVGTDDLSVKIAAGNLTGGELLAVRQFRNKAWSSAVLASTVYGADLTGGIADRVAEWRSLDEQKVALAMLAGVAANAAAGADAAAMIVGDGLSAMSNSLLIDAGQTKGEHKENLKVLTVHSAVHAKLAKDNLITVVPASEQSPSFEVYAGKRLVISDAMPEDDGVYTSILSAPGIISYGEAAPKNGAIEVAYDPAAGNGSGGETLYTRRQYIMGIQGYSYTGTANPTNEALAVGTNYARKFDAKVIPFVLVKTSV